MCLGGLLCSIGRLGPSQHVPCTLSRGQMPHCSHSSVYTTWGYNQEQSCWVRGPISTELGPGLQLAEFADQPMPPCACGPISHTVHWATSSCPVSPVHCIQSSTLLLCNLYFIIFYDFLC